MMSSNAAFCVVGHLEAFSGMELAALFFGKQYLEHL